MPAEKGFDPVPEAPEDQAEEKNRGGIIPPFPPEPVDRVPLGIMAPEESEQDGQQDSQAQQGQGGVPAADERKEEPEQGVEEGDLDDEPSVAVDQGNAGKITKELQGIPPETVPDPARQDQQQVGDPERDQDRGETSGGKGLQIAFPCFEAPRQPVAGEEKEDACKKKTGVIKEGDRAGVPGPVSGAVLDQMVQDNTETCRGPDHAGLVRTQKAGPCLSAGGEGGSLQEQDYQQQRI